MIPSRPLDLGGIINESIRIVKLIFTRSLVFSLIATLPGLLLVLFGVSQIGSGFEDFTHQYTTAAPETSVLLRDYLALSVSDKPELVYYKYQYPDIFSALDSTKDALKIVNPTLTNSDVGDKLDSIRLLVNARTGETTAERLLTFLVPGLSLFGFGCLLLLLGGLYQRGALFDLSCRAYENRALKFGTVSSYSFYRTMWLMGVQYLLIFLAMAIGMGLLVGITAALSPVLAVLGIFASFFFILYAIFRLLFCNVALVSEDLGPIPAIKRSLELTAGQFWRVAGITLIVALMITVVGSILGIPTSLSIRMPERGLAEYFRTGIGLETVFQGINSYFRILFVGYCITALLTASLFPAFITTFYYDLRTRHDGPLDYDAPVTPENEIPNPPEILAA